MKLLGMTEEIAIKASRPIFNAICGLVESDTLVAKESPDSAWIIHIVPEYLYAKNESAQSDPILICGIAKEKGLPWVEIKTGEFMYPMPGDKRFVIQDRKGIIDTVGHDVLFEVFEIVRDLVVRDSHD
jgi:hypothetical protein